MTAGSLFRDGDDARDRVGRIAAPAAEVIDDDGDPGVPAAGWGQGGVFRLPAPTGGETERS
ncbi:hypothetical protein HLB23_31165 [Nocardia uniformis]|uniref:Uncharacterized protein n=1 Tax=Nocardia uniformis TaxID=53432 RepID=A0A849C6L5_9NOCA|nr:hypothetical protein [Nocardia uniformis]NNH74262.1 hypothetical protein [Nocardia uniformis]